MLERLKIMHSLGYVHRDIKPANIVISPTNPDLFYLIDFGLSRKYSSARRIPRDAYDIDNLRLTGTPIYASVNSHLGWGSCFMKDDIESLIYVLIHMTTGYLPW